ncbi:MAG TPA: radical SAM protein [Terriglobia bacterium]|nr:radical SAM protein [Terriglobia bacterium]
MNVALIGAEMEENLALRYIASSLEDRGHNIAIVPFDSEQDTESAVRQTLTFEPQVVGLSMVFTARGHEFCRLAKRIREAGFRGHVIAGGPFASFNCERLVTEFPEFSSVGLGEGEELMCCLAENLDHLDRVPGLCYRDDAGLPKTNAAIGNPDKLDDLPWPKRTTFHSYFDKPIASVLTSRGCWRDCAFCSINAWYERVGGKKFRIRSVESIVAELSDLYHRHGVRIFNFQDDNFFLPNPVKAVARFSAIRDGLRRNGVDQIAIAVKARPDSITEESIRILDELGLFRVFLGVENGSENGLRNLNRRQTVAHILNALRILNDFDIHVAFNLLMFEPDTVLDDILTNVRFIERHNENPFNFCRAEAYPGTGLERKLLREGRLLGDTFGYDYRLQDPRSEAFHQIANYAFFDRNFSDYGLHYFNMQVDFYFQLVRRFRPELLTQTLRAVARNFIKQTNLDTYERCCEIYDFVATCDPADEVTLRSFARDARVRVDRHSRELMVRGERIVNCLEDTYARRVSGIASNAPASPEPLGFDSANADIPTPVIPGLEFTRPGSGWEVVDLFGVARAPMPYNVFRARLAEEKRTGEEAVCASR